MNKWNLDFGVESIGIEMQREQWVIPTKVAPELPGTPVDELRDSPEVAAWIADMLTFTPGEHTGDHLMACWVCREGARESGWAAGTLGALNVPDPWNWDTLVR